jgi:hypothetical protein
MAHEHVLKLEFEHALAIQGTQPGKISEHQRDSLSTTRKRHAHMIVVRSEIRKILFHVLSLHGRKREKELTRRLFEFLIANNEVEPTRRTSECEQQRICELYFQCEFPVSNLTISWFQGALLPGKNNEAPSSIVSGRQPVAHYRLLGTPQIYSHISNRHVPKCAYRDSH